MLSYCGMELSRLPTFQLYCDRFSSTENEFCLKCVFGGHGIYKKCIGLGLTFGLLVC